MSTRGRSNRISFSVRVLLLLAALTLPSFSAFSQNQTSSDLLDYFLRARARKIATDQAGEGGNRAKVLPVDPWNSLAERLYADAERKRMEALLSALPDPLDAFNSDSFRLIPRLRVSEYQSQFDETDWAFTGTSSRSALDTTRTADLRARLEFRYGAPTRTLAEAGYPDSLGKEEIIQFEYWFVLDDSVSVLVLDVNGPWDRGVVLAADMRFRKELVTIKKHLLEQLVTTPDRTRFIDYYFNYDQHSWYLTGFDGASFFDRRIQRPDLSLGRPSPEHLEKADIESN